MLTIFTIPKSFNDPDINIIQRNAIKSWLRLEPKCQIILFGDDKGVAEAAQEFGALHIPNIRKTEFGTPLLDDVFNSAQKLASNDFLMYINADIILTSDTMPAIQKIKAPLFLINGRRWDLNVKEEINFSDPRWEDNLRQRIAKEGVLHGFSGIDYFVFPRNLPHDLPSFAVGRPGWDNWLIYRIRSLKIPVVDATDAITVVHQNHESSHARIKKDIFKQEEARRNLALAGGFSHFLTLRDADWILTKEGLKRPGFPRMIFSKLSLFYPWRLLLSVKRRI